MANQSPNSGNINRPENNLSFRCADVGDKSCPWETSGRSEDEILRNTEQHAREKHGMDWSDTIKDKVRGAIRGWKAA